MVFSKIEFAVQMTCNNCVEKVKSSLSGVKGIENVNISLKDESVVIETNLPSSEVQRLIENTGKRAVLKGIGDVGSAAVAMLGGEVGSALGKIHGIIRFQQINDHTCVIDGTLDGLSPGAHGLHIHECGDLSNGCKSVGEHFNPRNVRHGSPEDNEENRHAGDLGNIIADSRGRSTFRLSDKVIKVWDLIGRSVVVTEKEDDLGQGSNHQSKIDGNTGERLACGIIARSAGIFENSKRICACDGVSLWDERDRPLAGPGRRNPQNNRL